MPYSIDHAGEWFLHSGIQEPCGGVARYYHSGLGKNSLVSTEITGYAASTLLFLHARSGQSRYLEAALRAGRFLTRTAWDDAARTLPFEFAVNGDLPQRRAYFFDLGIVARGLLSLWRACGDSEFLAAARACAESMARDFDAGHDFHPILLLPAKEPAPRARRWSRAPGCYQLKAALAWRELAGENGCLEFGAHYDRVLGYALDTHASFLPGEPEQERVMDRLHAYCYFLEGLLPCAARPDCAQAIRHGLSRVAGLLAEIAPVLERSDVRAQLLRLRLFAAALEVAPLDGPAAERERQRILEFQLHHPDRRIHGGFRFGRQAAEWLPHVNPVSTAFCAQALEMWRQYRAGGFRPDWRTLI